MAIKIRPYKLGSRGAKRLRECLEGIIGRRVWMTKRDRALAKHKVINWGGSQDFLARRRVNEAGRVRVCTNKLQTLRTLPAHLVPEWTLDIEVAREWARQGDKVYCRTLLSSFEGRGIVVAETPEQVVRAPLYTKRFKHSREYRVHVAFGNVIQIVQKRKRSGAEDANPLIRSNNGWVFARNLAVPHDSEEVQVVKDAAVEAFKSLNLDFGAFDILYSKRQNKAIILECNTAPGLDNTSASVYANAFAKELQKEVR